MGTREHSETRQLGLKISGSVHEEIRRRAALQDMAPTSLARLYVLEGLGMAEQFVRHRTGKRKVARPLTKDMKLKIAQLRELQLIRLNLELIQRGEVVRSNGQSEGDLADVLKCAKQVFKSLLAKPVGPGR